MDLHSTRTVRNIGVVEENDWSMSTSSSVEESSLFKCEWRRERRDRRVGLDVACLNLEQGQRLVRP